MTAALPPYPAYKDSGVPWLGRFPRIGRSGARALVRARQIAKHGIDGNTVSFFELRSDRYKAA